MKRNKCGIRDEEEEQGDFLKAILYRIHCDGYETELTNVIYNPKFTGYFVDARKWLQENGKRMPDTSTFLGYAKPYRHSQNYGNNL